MITLIFDIETKALSRSKVAHLIPNEFLKRPTDDDIRKKAESMRSDWKKETRLRRAEEWAKGFVPEEKIKAWLSGPVDKHRAPEFVPYRSIIGGFSAHVSTSTSSEIIIHQLTDDEISKEDDTRLVKELCQLLDDAYLVSGWNITGFDIPFVAQRAFITGTFIPTHFLSRFPGGPNCEVIDAMLRWNCGRDPKFISKNEAAGKAGLEEVARVFKLGRKPLDVNRLWSASRDERENYMIWDIKTTTEICRRVQILPKLEFLPEQKY